MSDAEKNQDEQHISDEGIPTADYGEAGVGPGAHIGPYKLLRILGEGGFGIVYLAEQEHPVRRQVALKVIKPGMDSRQVIARFEAERQALALLDHPNIAYVFDAGTTASGHPYFAMEHISGMPITEYCDRYKLGTRARLELFISLCQGIQYAHQKGIIHRDIKPSNVLVTLQDGKPILKIIDFGVAKALNQHLTEKTLFTDKGEFIGTPEYMSPEQAGTTGLDIDTRADIYSLGVLLYELLTGSTPFDGKELRSKGYAEIQRILCEQDPVKPSTRLTTLGEKLKDIARCRSSAPDQLRRTVRGDLDWIVMKTLEKDRTRRYSTADGLATDIEHHLNHEPVLASPPSTTYRLGKLIRRNKGVFVSVGAVAAVLILGLIVSTTMYFQAKAARENALEQQEIAEGALKEEAKARTEAERQAKISEAVNSFLNDDLLASVDPDEAKGREVTVREVLDLASSRIEHQFKDEPLIEASIRETLGNTYKSLGEYDNAEKHLERAREIREDQLGDEDPITLDSIGDLGSLYAHQGCYEEAETLLVYVLEVRRRVLGKGHPDTISSKIALSGLRCMQGRYNEADSLLLETLADAWRHPRALTALGILSGLYLEQGREDEAEDLLNHFLAFSRFALGDDHPETLVSAGNLGSLYMRQGRYEEAEALIRDTLEIEQRALGEEHPQTLMSASHFSCRVDQGADVRQAMAGNRNEG